MVQFFLDTCVVLVFLSKSKSKPIFRDISEIVAILTLIYCKLFMAFACILEGRKKGQRQVSNLKKETFLCFLSFCMLYVRQDMEEKNIQAC